MKTKNNYEPLIVDASECYRLMTNPRNKGDELSETTKSWLKEKAVEVVLGLRNKVTTPPMMKGAICKQASINLYNKVKRSNYKRNNITLQNCGFCGTPDVLGVDCVVEIVTSWDATTFPFFGDEVSKLIKKCGYDWQCRVNMMLFGRNSGAVSYCLVDTPTVTPNGEPLLHKCDDTTLHRFDGKVEAHKRVSTSEVIERDRLIEQKMLERYAVANRYYQNYLAELHNK